MSISPAHITTVSRKGSSTNPFPNSSITIMVSMDVPPKPPDSSEREMPNQPNSAKVFQLSALKPKSLDIKDCLVSQS